MLMKSRQPVNTSRGRQDGNLKFDSVMQQVQMMFGILYDRIIQYSDYEYMLQDAIISSAVELYVEDATQPSSENGKVFWINSTNDFLNEEFESFVQRLDLEKTYTDTCYNLSLYGDQFPRLYWGNTSEGLLYMDHRIHPADVEKASMGNYILGFRYDNKIYSPKDFYHIKLNFSKAQRREYYNWMIINVDGYDFRVRTDYGTSVLENARKIYKVLNLLENCLIIARMSRSPLQQVIGVQFGANTTHTEALTFINKMKEALSENNTVDLLTKNFESAKENFQLMKRLFIPLFGEKGTLEINNLGGDIDIKDIADIDYFRSKLYGALRTPKAYLGMEESLPGSLGESALARLEIRYGKNVKRIQHVMIQYVFDIFALHLAHIGKSHLISEYTIEGTPISSKEDEERRNALQTSITTARDLIQTMQDLEVIGDNAKEKQNLLKTINTLFLKIPGFNSLFPVEKKPSIKVVDNLKFWEEARKYSFSGAIEIVKQWDGKKAEEALTYRKSDAAELCELRVKRYKGE